MLRLSNNDIDIQVSPDGGGLTKALFRGVAFLEPVPVCCFPLVPFGNRVAENRFHFQDQTHLLTANTAEDPLYLHGDGWLMQWSIIQQSETQLILACAHPAPSRSPYCYQATQTISLDRNKLTLHLIVKNTGYIALPFGLGFHPFFRRTPQTRLLAPAKVFWNEGAGHLPDKPGSIPGTLNFAMQNQLPDRWVNNAFEGWNGKAHIVWPELQMRASLVADPVFSNYMIYAPEHRRDFFCFEPMSHLPNGHNMPDLGGLTILEPGDAISGGFCIQIDETKD